MNGWIHLHRKLLGWEWYSCMKTTRVFLHLLLIASWKDARWQGIEIPRGSVFLSPDTLASATGLSRQQVRTIINRLKSTSEITTKSTSKGTLITLCNFDTYNTFTEESNQRSNQQANQHLTSDQPAINQRLTTSKEGKKDKKERSDLALTGEPARAERDPSWNLSAGWEGIKDSDLAKWSEAFPACDIKRQLAAMSLWLEANPAKARKSNWRRFISTWLSKSQDRGGDIAGGFNPQSVVIEKPKRSLPINWREISEEIYGQRLTCQESELTSDQRADIYRHAR